MSESIAEVLPSSNGLELKISIAAKLNLADYQNAVPVLREMAVFNGGERSWEGLRVLLSSDPPFFVPKSWSIDSIGPSQTCHISALDLRLDGPRLARLNETEFATVKAVLESEGAESPLLVLERELELLPRNHWGGLSHVPEMVAAFVQPNDGAVEKMLKSAAQLLRDNGCDAALDGYRSGSKHAWEILSAIWGAMAGAKFDYSLPPASFEQTGQKVRSPGQIANAGLGTCLDFALFFASMVEQAGLNPIIVFTPGHAFAGCWLRDEQFATPVVDDSSALRKRLMLRELLLIETTALTNHPPHTFARACDLGAAQLAEGRAFEMAVDIRRCRMHEIRPLATPEASFTEARAAILAEPASLPFGDVPDLPDELASAQTRQALDSLTPAGRIDRWQRKLLDLSLRNSLLNMRKSKRAVTFEAPDPGKLEDALASGKAMRILPHPDLMDGTDPRNRALHESRTQQDVRRAHALEGLSKGDIFALAEEQELESTLVELFRSARSSLEEGGANTLFLALGFLVWTQDGKAANRYRAPLVLIPVTLNRRSIRSGFTLTMHDDEPLFNPTLVEMLRQDFGLSVGIREGALPKDDSGLNVNEIWAIVSEAIKDIPGWEVLPGVVLSTFSFAKHLMWKDLVHRTEQLRENPVVRHLIDTPRETFRSGDEFVVPGELDSACDPRNVFCPLEADSSQLAAIMSAARGKDFVLIGPPGTGKSQTISNLIAHCIASGKRVLFVAEKIAALEVVFRRLQQQGLGQFCLELHSSKAKKASVLQALDRAWCGQSAADSAEWEMEADRLRELRDQLNLYVARLHLPRNNGMTAHHALGQVVAGKDVTPIDCPWPDPPGHGVEQLKTLREIVTRLEIRSTSFGSGDLKRTALSPVGQPGWTPIWQDEFLRSVRATRDASSSVTAAYQELAAFAGLPSDPILTAQGRAAACDLAAGLPACVRSSWAFTVGAEAPEILAQLSDAVALVSEHRSLQGRMGEPWHGRVIADCRKGLDLLRKREEVRSGLPSPWPAALVADLQRGLSLLPPIQREERRLSVRYDVTRVNVSALATEWEKAETAMWPLSFFEKRRLRAALAAAVTEGGEPNAANDLPILRHIDRMKAEVAAIDLRALPPGIWSGLQTSVDVAKAALDVQAGLASILKGTPWAPANMDLVESGLCGPGLRQTCESMRSLSAIDLSLASLSHLTGETDGVWAGRDTAAVTLEAALEFCQEWQTGGLRRSHDLVRAGLCGERLREVHELLCQSQALANRIDWFQGLAPKTGGLWRAINTDVDDAAGAIRFGRLVSRTLPVFVKSDSGILSARAGIARLCQGGTSQPGEEYSSKFTDSCSTLAAASLEMSRKGYFPPGDAASFESCDVTELYRKCERILAEGPRLVRWCSWVHARGEALNNGLGAFVKSLEEGLEPARLSRAFEVNYCRSWLNHVVTGDPVLRTFASAEHEHRIAEFRAIDDRYTQLAIARIRAQLTTSIPGRESPSAGSEWGILRHELTKKKRHLPLRDLMARIPEVVTALTPCLLMSPLSIAQYLALSKAAFDIVVFDEASQIAVWDAVGAIARGKQVVMVGDPKQLPPTSFFSRGEDETEADGDVPEDMESILDECIAAGIPRMQLSWHYRSRHESLIAFSNRRYYEGRLVTFPSPVTDDRAVRLFPVTGLYEKGGARTNLPEARALVRHLLARLKDEEFARAGYSIGVVTFNSEQQKLIEDLLDAARREDPSIEPFFSPDNLEPVFIKNLESVQGDERDLIYFSITYGPDITGKISMNFGPMNRNGGERRLNVAITRARRELQVFSSLRPDQIDLSRTQSAGVSELKHFLEFAARGPRAFAEFVTGSRGAAESPFEESVATALRARGWVVHTQVGASGYRIDLGIVHPDFPGAYLAGVECDGAAYHRSATARDRDKLREHVLVGLGWKIVRIWSTDWWIDPVNTLDRLVERLGAILETSRSKKTTNASAVPGPSVESEPDVAAPEETITAPTGAGEAFKGNRDRTGSPSPAAADSSKFFDRSYDHELARIVSEIVEREGPVLDEVLSRRVARLHGWQRTGGRINERVSAIASKTFQKTVEELGGTFFWPAGLEAGSRIAFRPGLDRTVDEICMPELVSLALDIINSGANEDVVAVLAKSVGLQRLRTASRPRLESAVHQARQLSNS